MASVLRVMQQRGAMTEQPAVAAWRSSLRKLAQRSAEEVRTEMEGLPHFHRPRVRCALNDLTPEWRSSLPSPLGKISK